MQNLATYHEAQNAVTQKECPVLAAPGIVRGMGINCLFVVGDSVANVGHQKQSLMSFFYTLLQAGGKVSHVAGDNVTWHNVSRKKWININQDA